MNPIHRVQTALNIAPASAASPEKIKGAAQQFESLMISELLKTARESGSSAGGGWMGTGEEDQAGQNCLDMAEQQFSNVMAKAGGLGLQNFITQGLTRTKDPA